MHLPLPDHAAPLQRHHRRLLPRGLRALRRLLRGNQDIDCSLNDGAVCSHSNQCRNSCTDGRCCSQSCAVCQACTGSGGTCVPVAALGEDNVPAGACAGNSSCDGSTAGPAACKLDDGQPCMTADQCASGACTTFFRDGDSDGQVAETGTRFCGSTAPPGFQAIAGPDCCDSDPAVKMQDLGLVFFTAPSACGNFDYDCASGEQRQHTGLKECGIEICRSGWEVAGGVPGCGQTGQFGECVLRSLPVGGFCDIHAPTEKTQGCR